MFPVAMKVFESTRWRFRRFPDTPTLPPAVGAQAIGPFYSRSQHV